MPTYGPFTSSRTTPCPAPYGTNAATFLRRKWMRQSPITGAPNAFEMDSAWLTRLPSGAPPTSMNGQTAANGPVQTPAFNMAYGQLVDQKGAAAEMAVNLLETKQAGQMLDKRLTQMYNFAKSVRKYRWADAARHLGLKSTDRRFQKGRPPGVKRGAKHYANNILEYNFGWAPLANDISSAVEVIQRKPPRPKIKGSGFAVRKDTVVATPTVQGQTHTYTCGCLVQAELEITSPNLFLANQLGFVNAGSILWERVPFSFVVDWFVNVGQVIASFTDWYGVTLRNSMTTFFSTRKLSKFGGPYPDRAQDYEVVSVRRLTSISGPSLYMPPFKGLSAKRGLNACALLVQMLKS